MLSQRYSGILLNIPEKNKTKQKMIIISNKCGVQLMFLCSGFTLVDLAS